ncbi:hypothetical protein HO173_006866 [Letharia columbiana]|uniref:Uncharacterized protein n=1 Tax=Letharia columbiana TaxID=112416 RepID=A0A8H6L486_9LECA|nr:uncharacterized protein HO173_006866 [Letharia columbiana]KAF6234936.1 hypothetical protein HO173_006866 [Letharia columbiana]
MAPPASPSSPMAPPALPRELYPFNVARGDFLYKTVNQAEWTRLPSPIDDPQHNCYGIRFDGTVTLTQKHRERGSMCRVKLILKPPIIKTEDDQTTVEAVCIRMGNPSFSAYPECHEKVKAVEHAKTLPLATLDKTITLVKLRNLKLKNLSVSREEAKRADNYELGERIWALIDHGYRGTAPPGQTKRINWTVLPRPSSSGSAETPTNKRTLKERLQAHQVATAEGESRLRQGLEDDRQTMVRKVTEAINGEWDKKVATAVAEHRAQTASTMEKIVAEGNI